MAWRDHKHTRSRYGILNRKCSTAARFTNVEIFQFTQASPGASVVETSHAFFGINRTGKAVGLRSEILWIKPVPLCLTTVSALAQHRARKGTDQTVMFGKKTATLARGQEPTKRHMISAVEAKRSGVIQISLYPTAVAGQSPPKGALRSR